MKVGCIALVSIVLAVGSPARADEAGYPWSVTSATTDSAKTTVLSAEIGFPGFTAGFTRGLTDFFDIGGRLDLNYGLFFSVPGQFSVGARVPMRFHVLRSENIEVLVRIEPGIVGYPKSGPQAAHFGITATPGAEVAWQVIPKLRIGASLNIPMFVDFLNGGGFGIAPMIGPSAEYYVLPQLSLGLNTLFGPDFYSEAKLLNVGFVVEVVVGWRL